MLNRQFAGGELGRDWVEMREHKISSGEDMSKYTVRRLSEEPIQWTTRSLVCVKLRAQREGREI